MPPRHSSVSFSCYQLPLGDLAPLHCSGLILYCPTPPARLASSQKGLALIVIHTPVLASAHTSAWTPRSFAFLSPLHAFVHLINKLSLTSAVGQALCWEYCAANVPTSLVSEPGEGDGLVLIINCQDKALSRISRMPSWKLFLKPLKYLGSHCEPLPCSVRAYHTLRTAPSLVCSPLSPCAPEGRARVCFSSLYPQG